MFKFKAILLAAALALPLSAYAESALEIVKKASLASYYAGDDGKAQMLMKVYPQGGGKAISKLFVMLKKDVAEGGEQMFLTYFQRPSDIQKTTFLVHKKIGEDDLRRLYLPASDKVLAISGARKQDPFMGSDFSYEDVSGRHFSKDDHKLLGEETLKEQAAFIVESTPKVKEEKIARMKAWIAKDSYIPLKVEFYDHQGEVFKIYKTGKVMEIDGITTIMHQVMESPKRGTKTELLVNPKQVAYNLGLSESVFSERSLKNPPMQYIR
ncbi:MAG: outer membrane lipoprotein-sorting protein [bacterium]|nr:outer membrane lipoprotein-sorting protein [bacterium]